MTTHLLGGWRPEGSNPVAVQPGAGRIDSPRVLDRRGTGQRRGRTFYATWDTQRPGGDVGWLPHSTLSVVPPTAREAARRSHGFGDARCQLRRSLWCRARRVLFLAIRVLATRADCHVDQPGRGPWSAFTPGWARWFSSASLRASSARGHGSPWSAGKQLTRSSSERLTTPARPLPRPDANLGYLFRLAHQCFRARLDSELEGLGLSAQDYGILSVFETRPELSTSELARISQVTRQTMHTSVLNLEAAGLVERSARNQRVVLVRLTNRGRNCLATATRRVRVAEHAALAGLSREDERTVRAWLANLAAMPATPEEAAARRKEKS
jgi:DNA-binding MarR family transcriptional regulator